MCAPRHADVISLHGLYRKYVGTSQDLGEAVVLRNQIRRRHLVFFIPNETVQRSQGPDQCRVKPDGGHGFPVVSARAIGRNANLTQQAS